MCSRAHKTGFFHAGRHAAAPGRVGMPAGAADRNPFYDGGFVKKTAIAGAEK